MGDVYGALALETKTSLTVSCGRRSRSVEANLPEKYGLLRSCLVPFLSLHQKQLWFWVPSGRVESGEQKPGLVNRSKVLCFSFYSASREREREGGEILCGW